MTKSITLTDEQWTALQQGDAITLQPPEKKIEKWEPAGGRWRVLSSGYVGTEQGTGSIAFGANRSTEVQAEEASVAMRKFNRLLAYRDEFAPDYEPDWQDWRTVADKHSVMYKHKDKKWNLLVSIANQPAGAIYMPKDVAEELVRKLNLGEVVL